MSRLRVHRQSILSQIKIHPIDGRPSPPCSSYAVFTQSCTPRRTPSCSSSSRPSPVKEDRRSHPGRVSLGRSGPPTRTHRPARDAFGRSSSSSAAAPSDRANGRGEREETQVWLAKGARYDRLNRIPVNLVRCLPFSDPASASDEQDEPDELPFAR